MLSEKTPCTLKIPARLRGPIKKKFLIHVVTPVITGEFGIE